MAQRFKLKITGMTCQACVSSVDNAIRTNLPENSNPKIAIDLVQGEAQVEHDDIEQSREVTLANLKNALEDIGFECEEIIEVNPATAANLPPADTSVSDKKKKIRKHIIKGVIGLVAGAVFLALAFSGIGIPMIAMYAMVGVSTLLTLGLGWESYVDAFKKLFKSRTLTMDSLFAISTLAVIGVSIASLFVPGLPMMMEAGILIFAFRHVGKAVEESLRNKVSSGMAFRDRGAKKVLKWMNNEWVECDADTLQANDIIRIRHHHTIPVDGVCISENTSIYTTIISGAPLPVVMKRNENIYAGMKVPANVEYIEMRVTNPVQQSYLARLDDQISRAHLEKAPLENTAQKILKYFIPIVLGLAAISGIVIGVLFNPALAIQCATAILVSACPCIFGIIIPFSVKIGMMKANEHGVQFKNDKALQEADKADTVVFDMNGTLTTGDPVVSEYQLVPDGDLSADEFFEYLNVIENQSKHPIAKAICAFAATNSKSKRALALDNFNLDNHSGIAATINGEECLVGNQDFLNDHDIHVTNPPVVGAGNQVIYFVRNGKIAGYVIIQDPLRKDAKFTIDELKKSGKAVHICTGADIQTALRYAEELGIPADQVHANCVGHSEDPRARTKAAYIEHLQSQGKTVAMVGDASNDAVAMAKSNFGIAVQSSASDVITQDNALAVINKQSLVPVVTTFAVSKETVRNIKINLGFSIAYNLATILIAGGVLVAIGFALNPAIGAALMVLQVALVLLNLYRVKQQQLAHVKRLEQTIQQQNQHAAEYESTYKSLHQRGITLRSERDAAVIPDVSKTQEIEADFEKSYPVIDNRTEMRPSCC